MYTPSTGSRANMIAVNIAGTALKHDKVIDNLSDTKTASFMVMQSLNDKFSAYAAVKQRSTAIADKHTYTNYQRH